MTDSKQMRRAVDRRTPVSNGALPGVTYEPEPPDSDVRGEKERRAVYGRLISPASDGDPSRPPLNRS